MRIYDKNYWDSSENSILSNQLNETVEKSICRIASRLNMSGKIIISTSGTTGSLKFTVISKQSMLRSADAVNKHLNIISNDKWLCCLPTTHVSGLSVHARASQSRSAIVEFKNKWSPDDFIKHINDEEITLCSLVPTQLHDIINLDYEPSADLRALIIGGDRLSNEIRNKALDLGWPVLLTYGMTETCSQVATENSPGEGMEILSIWDIKVSTEHELLVKGTSLFDGYIEQVEGDWKYTEPILDDGWFSTGDIANISKNKLTITGRKDSQIKVLGEKINFDKLRSTLSPLYGQSITLMPVPDSRKGNKIIMVAEETSDHATAFNKYNTSVKSIERAEELIIIDNIPRTPLGKIHMKDLYDTLEKRRDA